MAAPRELTLCLDSEPESLYIFGLPEPGREHILAALYDGPIDRVGFGFQPVLVEQLPSPAGGDAFLESVPVQTGDLVVDALGRAAPLAPGMVFRLANGATQTYASGALNLPRWRAIFRLLPGARWSDGAPLTAPDSVFAYEVSRAAESYGPWRDLANRTQSYRALDAAHVEWTGLPGDLDPLYFARFWPPLPRHIFAGLTAEQISDSELARRSPLAWGPYAVREWAAGDRLVLERNPHYFRRDQGLPELDRLIFRFVPAGAANLQQALDEVLAEVRAGRCDLAPTGPALAEAPSEAGVYLLSGLRPALEQLTFNLAPSGERPAYFAEARARQAVAHCLDRARLAGADNAPAAGLLPPGHPRLADGLPERGFDPALGRRLLEELGWQDTDGDGRREWNGVAASLDLVSGPAGDPLRERLLANVAGQLQSNCGLPVVPRLLTRGELEADWPEGVVFGRRYDLALFGWRIGAAPPCELYLSEQIAGPGNPGGANAAGYASAEYDRACSRALAAGQAADFRAAQVRLAADLPLLPLFFRQKFALARPGLSGLSLDDFGAESELWNVETWVSAP